MRRAPSQGAISRAATSSPGGSPVRRPAALVWNASLSASAAGPSSSLSSSSPQRRKTTTAVRRSTLTVRASSAVASPPPPAASSTMGGGSGGGDLGEVTAIHGPEELDATLAAYPDRLVVLMAKSAGCRPCKAFARKYQRVAALYPRAVFLVVTGDESKETRAMMMAMKVRVTPTFFVYRDRALFKTTTGVNENNLKAALDEAGGNGGSGSGGGGSPAAAAAASTEEAAAA